MQFETLLLRGLFLACLTVSSLILGAMLIGRPQPAQLAVTTGHAAVVASVLTAQAPACALPADGVICPRRIG